MSIVGDVHGQFYDFVKIIDPDTGGPLDSTKYLFLGDYVDRGCFSIEVLALIFSIKINYKKTIFMLRGNHECRQLTSYFNFRSECNSVLMKVFKNMIRVSMTRLWICLTICLFLH